MKVFLFFIIDKTAYILFPIYLFHKIVFKKMISLFTSKFIEIELKLKNNTVGKNFRVGRNCIIKVHKDSNVLIGKNVIINDNVYINVKANASLKIGDNVHIGYGVRISSFESVTIGEDTLIASYCNILDHNHLFDLKSSVVANKYKSSPINIGKGVWLGTKVQINKKVNIGNFSVIAANSVVVKDIETSSVYAGVPAKKLR